MRSYLLQARLRSRIDSFGERAVTHDLSFRSSICDIIALWEREYEKAARADSADYTYSEKPQHSRRWTDIPKGTDLSRK